MDVKRALEIYTDKNHNFEVKLEGQPVWIENVDEVHGMATVQVGPNPTNTQTVKVERLQED
ncbi:H-type small acid-soluble spore protein [Paenibacillus sp. KQZ6P-2]|uniref:H-type small acid-soluble spore protein n=1 Tax=Paenibacillus mangrovi TaxID=2931978 RepID=A0A9X2B4D8_9BACL|nr:H-type small acid-soluble spore protein [Paenibacillus mangrovi]MCJ8014416.1 H-type small acid-soluble spore protein [Paenibacillus mangrovi]